MHTPVYKCQNNIGVYGFVVNLKEPSIVILTKITLLNFNKITVCHGDFVKFIVIPNKHGHKYQPIEHNISQNIAVNRI